MSSHGYRTPALAAVAVAVVGVCAFLMYRNGVFERWFARDTENAAEVGQLRQAPPAPPPTAASAIGWPQFLGPTRNGRAPDGPFRTDWDKRRPEPVWTTPLGGGFSSVAVVGGKLYTQDRQGDTERVVCLDAATGAPLWDHSYPASYAGIGFDAGPRATPTVDGNRVYAVGATGPFVCLEVPPAPGQPPRVVWQHDLPREFNGNAPQWGYACSPLLDGDRVIVQPGGRDGSVVAFDKATGEARWAVGKNPAGYSSPVAATVHGVPLVFALTGDALLCLRSDGSQMGSYSWPTRFEGNVAAPVVLDDYVFVSAAYGMGCALLRIKADGDRVRLEPVYAKRNKALRSHHSTPVVVGRHLYGFDGDADAARFICFSLIDGAPVEGWDAAGVRNGKVIAVGGYLVVLTQTGDLILVEATPEEYRPVATVPLGFGGQQNWSQPVLVDGRLYVRGPDKLICLDVRP
ncbi:PQQ-like beta-propeller repeat protein [bacterium]|nr:PQQ-like beta-propeller repeat protein [bacterium]